MTVLDGPIFPTSPRKARFFIPAIALFGGMTIFAASQSAQALNTADPVLAGATDLGSTASYTTAPTATSDIEFLATPTTYSSSLGLSAALSIGTLDDLNTSAIAINGSGLLTLNTAANSVAPNAADLLFVATGGNLSIQTSGGITFTPTGNVDDAGTLSLGTSPVTITTGTTLSFVGAGATTVGGVIGSTTGSVAINNAGGSVTFSGANTYTGTTTIYNGGLLSADATSAIGTGAVTLNPGATLRTLSTSGGSLGGGAVALNTSTIQVGNGTVANPSATLPGALALSGGTSTINLQDNGSGTASLTFSSATAPTRANGSTLIVNGATALNGTADILNLGPTSGGLNTISNGIFPGYEVGTVGGSTTASYLTTTTGTVNNPVTFYITLAANIRNGVTGATFGNSTVYELQGASTITSNQNPYAAKFDSGATLALGTFTLGTYTGGLIFNGTGDAITGGTINPGGNELSIYTGGTATISSNITSSSGGGFLTFFGPGTLTLTGTSIADTNSGGAITVNGNVVANIGTPFGNNSTTINGGTFTVGLANIFNGAAGGAVAVNSLGTLDLHGNNVTVSNLTGGSSALILGGNITNSTGSAVLTLNPGSTQTYYGRISSTGLGLTKVGSNTQNLDGALSYGGTTSANGGTLAFSPVVAGVNDSLGALSFGLGLGTVQSTYQGTGTTTLTFSNLLARTAGAEGNFTISSGTNGTTNKIVLTNVAGATPTAGTLLDRGTFFGGSAYATVDAGGFVRGYASSDTGAVTAAGGTSNIVSAPTSNVFVTGSQTAQATTSVNTLNLGTSSSVTLASGSTLSTNGILANGTVAISGGTGLTTTTSGGELVLRDNTNTLTLGTPILNNGGTAVTTSGNVTFAAGNTYTGVTTVDSGTATINAGTNLTNSSGVTVTAGGVLANSGTVGGVTTAIGGTATLNGGSTTGAITNNGTVNVAGTTAVTTGAFSGSGATGQINYTNTLAAGNTLNFSGTNSFLELNNTAAGGLLTLTGPGSVNTFTLFPEANNGLTTTATKFVSGTYIFATHASANVYANNLGTFTVAGATVQFGSGLQFVEGGGGTVTVSSGALSVVGAFDTNQQNSGTTSNFVVTGGLFDVSGGGTSIGNEGSKTSATTSNLTISGTGLFQAGVTGTTSSQNITIGSNNATNDVVTVALQAGGTIRDNGTIQSGGALGTGSSSNFNWTGGTLTAGTVNMTNLTDNDGITTSPVAGTLYNGGGTLAPGYFGQTVGSALGSANAQFTGKTTITGNYQVDSTNAALAVNLGGTTAATAFGAAATNYDNVSVSGTTVLNGRLNVGLINSFTPTSANTFTVLTSTGAISGNFDNYQVAKSGATNVIAAGGTGSFSVAVPSAAAGSVVLSAFTAGNTYTGNSTAWDAAGAASWSVYDPGSSTTLATPVASGAVAVFGDGDTTAGAATVSLNSTRNVAGILFNSTNVGATNYTISQGGSGAIILDNTANGVAATIIDSSARGNANAINVPITLNSPLTVTVTNAANTLTVGGAISGAQPIIVNGSGTLLVNGNVGSTATPSGMLTVSSGATLGGTSTVTVTSASVIGTLAPGATVNATTGALTLNTTGGIALSGTLQIGITSAGGTSLSTNGALNLGSASILAVTGTSGATAYDIANYGSLTGTFNAVTIPTGYSLNYDGTTFGAADIELDMASVPEPSSWLGAALTIVAGAVTAYRRKFRLA